MPPPICIVRRWAMSVPRKTRLETSDRYSSFLRKSESNKGIMSPSRHQGRLADRLQDVGDHLVGLDVLGLALEVEDEPVAQGGGGDGADVLAGHVVAAVEDGAE